MSAAAVKAPRIAIIGNMNNAGFCIMRYFRDLGADAHLLAYATDGTGNLAHFATEADTWEHDRWAPFIHRLPFPNTTEAAIGNIARLRPAPGLSTLRAHFGPFERTVGSGITPALFARMGQRLDLFWPYGMGIEFYGDTEFLDRMNQSPIRKMLYKKLRTLQAQGVRQARFCNNAELSLTADSLREIGKPFQPIALPAVYNREDLSKADPSPTVRDCAAWLAGGTLSLFCCSRLLWVPDPRFDAATWESFSKHSDWLLRGLRLFKDTHRDADVRLALVEYGPDVEATRHLVAELGLADSVRWMPKMARREIQLLLAAADIGVGEFYTDPGALWGGTGWEVLAAGKPLLQSFNFSNEGFEAQFGHPPPPVLDAKSAEAVAEQLTMVHGLADRGRAIGMQCADWFGRYNGLALARVWLDQILSDDERPA